MFFKPKPPKEALAEVGNAFVDLVCTVVKRAMILILILVIIGLLMG